LRRKILLITLLVLLLLFAVAPVMSLPVSAKKNAEESEVETADVQPLVTVLNAEESEVETADVQPLVTVFSDGFEGSWVWTRGDLYSSGGTDTWYRTTYRRYSGSYSAWCAQYGSQSVPTTIFSDGFEGSWTWSRGDWDSRNGYDYWGKYTIASHTGSASAWCSAVGDMPTGVSYDLYMRAYMYRTVDLSRYSGSVTLSFWYWIDTEAGVDYLRVMYHPAGAAWTEGSWIKIGSYYHGYHGWTQASVSIPITANAVGFYFYSDYSIVESGALVDDVTLTGTPASNSAIHKYDDNMGAYMYRAVDLSGYSSATLSYRYWLQSETGYDRLYVYYRIGSSQYATDMKTGSSSGWVYDTTTIPTTATGVGFYFYSDSSNVYEGAYVDDVVLTATGATPTVLDFWFTPNPVATGATCTLSGTLKTTGGAAVYPASVTVEYSTDGGATWHYAFTPSTTPAGTFAATFTAPAPGTYLVRGRYLGSASYNPSSHTETLLIEPAAWGDYHFRLSPFVDVIHIKLSGSVVYGVCETSSYSGPLLGWIEGSTFYIFVDFPDGEVAYELMMLVGSTSTLSGNLYRTVDGKSWVGPNAFSLTSVSSASGSSAMGQALASAVEPESWPPTYHFRLSPWVDIVRLGVDGSVIHGTDESASYPYHDQPVLGYVSGSFFALGIDWTKDDSGNEIYYELGLIRASTSTMSGYAYRTTDGKSFVSGPAISFVSVPP